MTLLCYSLKIRAVIYFSMAVQKSFNYRFNSSIEHSTLFYCPSVAMVIQLQSSHCARVCYSKVEVDNDVKYMT